jgi:hypothetical protein
MGLIILYIFANNKTCVEKTVKLADFFVELPYSEILIGDVLLRRLFFSGKFFVTETLSLLQETFCYRDALLWRRFV